MKKQQTQSGFAAVELVLILIIIALVGFVGWTVYNNRAKDSSTTSSTNQSSDKKDTPTTETSSVSNEDKNKGYLVIKEWGVKVKITDIDKVTYKYSIEPGVSGVGRYDSSAVPIMKPEFLQDKTCSVGVAMYRSTTEPESSPGYQKKIGEYYYFVTGGPGACSNDPTNNPDDILKKSVLKDFSTENLEAL